MSPTPAPRGSAKLEQLDTWITQNKYVTQQDLLLAPLRRIEGQYDYVFIDLPPRISPATVPSMKAAQYVVLCAIPEDAAVRYLARTWNDVQQARKHGLKVEVLGILLTSIRKPLTRLARTLLAQVGNEKAFRREDGTPLKFETDINLGVALQESQAARQTLFQYEPDHLICEQYRAVVRDMEARIRDRERGVLVPQPRTVLPTMPVVVGEEELQAGEAGNG
ncbi:MAG: ParA family protein [Planctomycetota bacterium]